jgi:hypothetical protein
MRDKERWNEKEIKKVAKILVKVEKNKNFWIKLLDEIVHWMMILIILIGNTVIAGFLVLISALLDKVFFYLILGLFAISFGILVEIPLKDIEKLSKHKHFLSRIMLPVLALVNVYIIIGMRAVVENFTRIDFEFNTIAAGLTYGILFILPHFFIAFVKKLK